MDIVLQRMPQPLWVVGTAYIVAIVIAIPIGVYSAYRQYSWFDNAGTFITMVGFSVPPFFSGVLVIVIFSVQLGWFPSIYDTTHRVTDWESFTFQLKQMVMPVMVLVHVLRNSMIPVVTVIALGIPAIFGGAIITEQVFKVNGIGQMLISAIEANDIPTVQTLTFIFAVLIVTFNLIADILYGILDPRIRAGK